ncbi:MAG TPA: peptidoglycan recognition family protein [Phycisphaerales bacterium]|nr:peptidoglycan recognition family protein [Phycisphaerales bacterium]
MARTKPASRSKKNSKSLSRAQTVWASLVGAMTLVGGGLFLMERGPVAAAEGLSLTPLMATAGVDSLEGIFATRNAIRPGNWQAIVIHDSGTPHGTQASLDAAARASGLKGLGYQFVIGNGNGMEDGEILVGHRWRDQVPGAHAAGSQADWFNRHSIGICLVGDGNRTRPTRAQMESLVRLSNALCRELGIPGNRVYLHSEIAPTDDPGRLFPAATLRSQLPR